MKNNLGKTAGAAVYARVKTDALIAGTEDDARAEAGLQASAHMALAGIRKSNETYFNAFARAFMVAWSSDHNELPEVQAAQRLRSVNLKIDGYLRSSEATLANFATRFAEDALYAFEWAGSVIEAAGKQNVARAMRALVDEHGVDKALAFATTEALRGARHPSHSTSAVSNLANEAKTAAWAEYANIATRY